MEGCGVFIQKFFIDDAAKATPAPWQFLPFHFTCFPVPNFYLTMSWLGVRSQRNIPFFVEGVAKASCVYVPPACSVLAFLFYRDGCHKKHASEKMPLLHVVRNSFWSMGLKTVS